MFKPGHKKIGGRTKNTPNKDSIPLLQKAKDLGVDPFEVLLLFAGDKWKELGYDGPVIDPKTRQKAAGDAAQYIYPKLKAVEHSHLNPKINVNIEATSDQIKQIVNQLENDY